jgi:hypothetical protein
VQLDLCLEHCRVLRKALGEFHRVGPLTSSLAQQELIKDKIDRPVRVRMDFGVIFQVFLDKDAVAGRPALPLIGAEHGSDLGRAQPVGLT